MRCAAALGRLGQGRPPAAVSSSPDVRAPSRTVNGGRSAHCRPCMCSLHAAPSGQHSCATGEGGACHNAHEVCQHVHGPSRRTRMQCARIGRHVRTKRDTDSVQVRFLTLPAVARGRVRQITVLLATGPPWPVARVPFLSLAPGHRPSPLALPQFSAVVLPRVKRGTLNSAKRRHRLLAHTYGTLRPGVKTS
jgi:hypothetical protein